MTGKDFNKKELLAQNRIWVGCETNDDLPYIIDTAGEDHLVVGTDYGHADSATELLALDGVADDPRPEPRRSPPRSPAGTRGRCTTFEIGLERTGLPLPLVSCVTNTLMKMRGHFGCRQGAMTL